MPVSFWFEYLSDAVKNDVFKKAVYNKLVEKVSKIDTSEFVSKNKYGTDKLKLQKKFLILVDLLRKQSTILKVPQ